jgi:hypothetical protein
MLNADGSFSMTLSDATTMSQYVITPFLLCSGAVINPNDLKVAPISVGIASGSSFAGSLYQTGGNGNGAILGVTRIFADRDGSISGDVNCNKKTSVCMNLKKGWNQLLRSATTTTESISTTLAFPQGLKWYLIGFSNVGF